MRWAAYVLVAALVAACCVRSCSAQELNMDELLRRVDLEGGELDLDALLRQAGGSAPEGRGGGEAGGAPAPEGRARPSDAPAAGMRGERASSRQGEAVPARSRAEPRAGGGHTGDADQEERAHTRVRAEEQDLDLSEYEMPARATMGAFGFGDAAEADSDEPDGSDDDDDRLDDGSDDGDAEDAATGRTLSLRLDKTTLSILRRWTNFANGVLLMLLGPITLAISAGSLAFDKMILSVYVSLFGLLFSAQELRVEPVYSWLRSNFHFLTTHAGRAAFLVFSGNLLWTFGRVGVVPAVLTCANSAFNAKFQSILARFD